MAIKDVEIGTAFTVRVLAPLTSEEVSTLIRALENACLSALPDERPGWKVNFEVRETPSEFDGAVA